MIYRDMPPMPLKEVILPAKLFEEVAAYAHIGEAVFQMKEGWLITYASGKFHVTSVKANVVFNSENPLEALWAFAEWEAKNGEISNNTG